MLMMADGCKMHGSWVGEGKGGIAYVHLFFANSIFLVMMVHSAVLHLSSVALLAQVTNPKNFALQCGQPNVKHQNT